MVYSVLAQHYFTRSSTAQIKAYSRKYGDASNFSEKGQKRATKVKSEQKWAKYLKIWEKCTKFENILKKGR